MRKIHFYIKIPKNTFLCANTLQKTVSQSVMIFLYAYVIQTRVSKSIMIYQYACTLMCLYFTVSFDTFMR